MSKSAGQANCSFLRTNGTSGRLQTDAPELLRYRSNLLGSDLRLTNFGGGNTSSKLDEVDPVDGITKKVLWVKGSGGDLGSIKRSGLRRCIRTSCWRWRISTRALSAKTIWWRCTRS